jgi:hypothetical protein
MDLFHLLEKLYKKIWARAPSGNAAQQNTLGSNAVTHLPSAAHQQREPIDDADATRCPAMALQGQAAQTRTPAPNRGAGAAQLHYALPPPLAEHNGQPAKGAASDRPVPTRNLPNRKRQARPPSDLEPGTAHNTRATLNCLAVPVGTGPGAGTGAGTGTGRTSLWPNGRGSSAATSDLCGRMAGSPSE